MNESRRDQGGKIRGELVEAEMVRYSTESPRGHSGGAVAGRGAAAASVARGRCRDRCRGQGCVNGNGRLLIANIVMLGEALGRQLIQTNTPWQAAERG
jgi:hypothetical protein